MAQDNVSAAAAKYDVVIVGAGPAGLSGALILGRCRRRVLVCDGGNPRNKASQAMHGFLTRDGIHPLNLLKIAREQLQQYETVELRDIEVERVENCDDRFIVSLVGGDQIVSRKLLLATGVVDHLPDVPGIRDFYGTSVFHCPYCDGWEVRDKPLAVIAEGDSGQGLALTLTVWSADIVLCTNGPSDLADEHRRRLGAHGIRICEQKISRLEGAGRALERIVFDDGQVLPRSAIFVHTRQDQASTLPQMMGCLDEEKRTVPTGDFEATKLCGLYVAGDASRDTQLAIVAASEGANAAFAINRELLEEDLKRRDDEVTSL